MKAEQIAKTLEAVFKELSASKKDTQQMVYNELMAQLDEKERRHIRPGSLHRGVLTLYIDSPAWMYSLNLKKARLLKRLQETVDKTNQVAAKLDESIGNVQQLTKAAGETGAIISDINSMVRKIQMCCSVTTLSFVAGLKAALSVLTHGAIQKIASQREDVTKQL